MKKYITYEQYNRQIAKYNQAIKNGMRIIKPKKRIILGIICLIIALFPNGLGFIFYPLAFHFLGLGRWKIGDN